MTHICILVSLMVGCCFLEIRAFAVVADPITTTPPSLPQTTTSVYISPCNYFAQNQVLRCISPLVAFVNPTSPAVAFHPPLHDLPALCDRWTRFDACTADVPVGCVDMVAGHTTRFYRTICDNQQMRRNVSAEQECYLKLAADVEFAKCELNMTKEIDRQLQQSQLSTNSVVGGIAGGMPVDCRLMQEYLDCLSNGGYLDECGTMVDVELQLLESIGGRKCDLQVVMSLDDFTKPVCDSNGSCKCSQGYTYNVDEKQCRDVDECSEQNVPACSQRCVNTPGSYECACDERYFMLSNDTDDCIRKDQAAPAIFFAHGQSIWNISDDGQDFQLLRAGLKKTAMIDVDVAEKMIYYADIGSNKIERLQMKGGFPRNIQTYEVDGVEGLAVDWVARNLYTLRKDSMFVQQLGGRYRKTLYSGVMKLPRALVANPATGYLYVTEWSASAFIGRAAMDGSGFEQLIKDGVVWPNGLAIDHFAQRLYWGDAFLDTIQSADMNGQNRRTVIAENGNVPHIFGMAIFEDYLYWTDWTYRGILRANKRTGKNITVLAQTALLPYGIKIFHSAVQPSSPNPCEDRAGSCAQLCLQSPTVDTVSNTTTTTAVCACSDGFRLETDGKTCTSNCNDKQLLCAGPDPRCISRMYRCDGIGQCKDHSDEKDCPPRICLPGQFQCHDNKKCLLPGNVCDGTPQCSDQSDESFC